MQSVQQTIISQYSSSPTLVQLIRNLNSNIDPAQIINVFYALIWNVATAQGYGLDVWGRIVGIGRVLQVATSKYFGFEEATSVSADPFNQSPFYSGQQLTDNFVLSDDGFRTLIYAKALANISDGSVRSLNTILMTLFGAEGDVYAIDNLDMTMDINFTFVPTPVQATIVQQSGVLPRPTGVSLTVVIP